MTVGLVAPSGGCVPLTDAPLVGSSQEPHPIPFSAQPQLSEFVDTIMERLRAIETQLALLSDKAGIAYEQADDGIPIEVVDLVKAGDRVGAIKRLRELTGVDAGVAADVVNKI